LNGRDDVRIRSATANIAAHKFFHICVSRAARFVQERHRRHDLSGRAIATLVAVAGNERSLHRVQVFRLTDALNGRDLFAFVHCGEAETRKLTPAVNMHSARTTLAMIASLFRSGQMQVLSKTIEKRGARIDPQIVILPVNPKRYRDSILRG
jgi:hypothetical protein